jgi:macrolide-specific efflux system membrane fusion protein
VVTSETLTDKISARGDLVAKQQAALLFPTAGTVKAVAVVPGQSVEAGAILAELSAPSQQQNLLQRQSNLTIAKLNLQKLEAREAADIDLAIAREQLALAESLSTLAQQQHAATVLTAPFAGTVTMFSLQQGSRVSAYETVGTVANLESVEIRGMLPAEVRPRASVGQSAQIQLDGYGATTFAGTVTELADDADSRRCSLGAGQRPDHHRQCDLP